MHGNTVKALVQVKSTTHDNPGKDIFVNDAIRLNELLDGFRTAEAYFLLRLGPFEGRGIWKIATFYRVSQWIADLMDFSQCWKDV